MAVALLCAEAGSAEAPAAGLIVEEAMPHFAADRGGIRAGDVLTTWSLSSRDDQAGAPQTALATPFDLIELENEQHPKEPVRLHGHRDGEAFTVVPGQGRWRLHAKPRWNEAAEERYTKLLDQLRRDEIPPDIETAVGFVDEILQESGDSLVAASLLFRTAETAGREGKWPQAASLYRLAIGALDPSLYPKEQAHLHDYLAFALVRQSRFDEAHEAAAIARQMQETISPHRLGVAASLVQMGRIDVRRGRLDSAMEYLEEALGLQERQAPDSMVVARTLGEMGRVAATRRKPVEAERHYRRALDIADALSPNGAAAAGYINGLAIATFLQGDEAGAEELFERSLALWTELEPDSRDLAALLHNIGLIKKERGDFLAAEDYYNRSLEIQTRFAPDSAGITRTLNNLGVMSLHQGDLAGAEAYHQRVYAIRSEKSPDSLDLAVSLINLGHVARIREDYGRAESYYLAALDIQERQAPVSQEYAMILVNLGVVAQSRGDTTQAQVNLRRGLSVYEAIAPNARGVAETLTKLGDLARARNLLDEAEEEYRKALSIFEIIAPGTYQEALVLYGLADVHRSREDNATALEYFERAIDALEEQHGRLGGTEETKARARARYLTIYEDYTELLLEMGEQGRAFDVLERSRSKVLSDMLAERDLVFEADIPKDLERQRRMQARTYEKLQAELLSAPSPDRIEALQRSLHEVQLKQERIQKRLRASSPRLADLHYTAPILLDRVRETLEPGTSVLSYDVGENETHLFVLTSKGDLTVHTLPLSHSELDILVTRFRYVIDGGRWDENDRAPFAELAMDLYRQLVLPAESEIESAERILIVPDGPLSLLPFAALLRPNTDAAPLYLVQWKPFHVASSLTVYAQLRERRSLVGEAALVAFGNPTYSSSASGAESHALLRTGVNSSLLTDLPWSGDEVQAIGEIYRETATVFTREAATEEQAKALGSDVRYVHFAAHTVLNERRPLDTAIALATPNPSSGDPENGFLQAWEVYETVRLEAELVTLSACETALGTDYPGEGLIGLTRAFQYAGASSVLASLWKVNDQSTSQLMKEFYANLKTGMPKEQALQQAQIAMIESTDTGETAGLARTIRSWFANPTQTNHSHPYHWAGFVLSGLGG